MQITVSRIVSVGVFTAAVAGAATIGYVRGASAQQTYTYPALLTGENIGFQRTAPGATTGTLMIRIDGNWVPAQFPKDQPRILPVTK